MTRIAVLSDVHGNLAALEAVAQGDQDARSPDAVLVAGDLVLNGPEPAATVDALRELEADGALDRPGQHRRRRRRLRLRGAPSRG